MAKIGTAHVEIKPVLSEDALTEIMDRIEQAVAEGVRRGMEKRPVHLVQNIYNPTPEASTES